MEADVGVPALRWGEGDSRDVSVDLSNVVGNQSELVGELEAVAARNVEDPVFGFMIASSSGAPVLGTNYNVKKRPCGVLKESVRVCLRWRVSNVLSGGLHLLVVAITDRRGVAVYDWWKGAAWFTVAKEEKRPHAVTPNASVSFERLET